MVQRALAGLEQYVLTRSEQRVVSGVVAVSQEQSGQQAFAEGDSAVSVPDQMAQLPSERAFVFAVLRFCWPARHDRVEAPVLFREVQPVVVLGSAATRIGSVEKDLVLLLQALKCVMPVSMADREEHLAAGVQGEQGSQLRPQGIYPCPQSFCKPAQQGQEGHSLAC